MDFSGTRLIAADRDTVWARLNDPAVMLRAIPGCVSFTGSHADGYEAVVKVGIGPLKATFRGMVHLSDVVPPVSYRLDAAGQGALIGKAGGRASVRLDPVPGGTALHYRITSSLGGRLGSFGRDTIAATATRIADGFFDRLMAPPPA